MASAMYSGPVNSDTFRTQIYNDYEEIDKNSIKCTGIFNEYYFKNTNKNQNEINKLFEISYAFAQAKDPLTLKDEVYMSLGLHSSEDSKNVRNKHNLVVVLDRSGSMSSCFYSKDSQAQSKKQYKKKIEVAKEVLYEIFTILTEQDYFGIVLFDHEAQVLQDLKPTKQINQDEIKQIISTIKDRGCTNMEIGFKTALNMFQNSAEQEQKTSQFFQNSNRILFLTDANPNQGGQKEELISLAQQISEKQQIFTTFIGVGLDFNVDLVDEICEIPGANYFSVHSCEQFRQILVTDFNYIVTPIVFNAILSLQGANAVKILDIYGGTSDEDKKKKASKQENQTNQTFLGKIQNGMNQFMQNFKKEEKDPNLIELQRIKTAMASDVNYKGVKGGIILLKLQVDNYYEDINKQKYKQNYDINLNEKLASMSQKNENFESTGIQKAVALSKYYELMLGIADKKINKQQIEKFIQYLIITIQKTDDSTMQQEIDTLTKYLKQL